MSNLILRDHQKAFAVRSNGVTRETVTDRPGIVFGAYDRGTSAHWELPREEVQKLAQGLTRAYHRKSDGADIIPLNNNFLVVSLTPMLSGETLLVLTDPVTCLTFQLSPSELSDLLGLFLAYSPEVQL